MVRRALVLAAVLTLVLAAAAHAAPPWSAPQTLTGAETVRAAGPAVLAGGNGDALVAFNLGSALGLARRAPGDPAFGPPAVPPVPIRSPEVLPYATSRIMVVSLVLAATRGLRVRFGSTAGALGSARILAPDEKQLLRFDAAANARGDAVVAFVAERFRNSGGGTDRRILRVVRRTAGRDFGAVETIVGRGFVNSVAVAINDAGDIVVAYDQQGRVQTRSRPRGRGWQPIDEVTSSGPSRPGLRVALGSRGRAVLGIFAQLIRQGGSNGPASVLAALREPGHRFRTPQRLDGFSQGVPGFGIDPGVTEIGMHGERALAAWTGRVGDGFGVRVATLSGTRFGAPRDVSPAGQQLEGLAIGDGGRATVVWKQAFTTPQPPTGAIGAAVRAPDASAFGPPEVVSEPEALFGDEVVPNLAAVGYAPRSGAPTIAWVAAQDPDRSALRVATRATP